MLKLNDRHTSIPPLDQMKFAQNFQLIIILKHRVIIAGVTATLPTWLGLQYRLVKQQMNRVLRVLLSESALLADVSQTIAVSVHFSHKIKTFFAIKAEKQSGKLKKG